MKYTVVKEEEDYIVVRFKTKVSHEVVVPKNANIEEELQNYLKQYEEVYPETRKESILDKLKRALKI